MKQWLDEAFGTGSAECCDGALVLTLDDPRTTEVVGLPVTLSQGMEGVAQPQRVPLLREKHITPQLASPLERPAVEPFAGDVQLVAFHSFKGGVGRTVHAVAMADAVAQRAGASCLIDADLEAPGITWMHRSQGGQLDFCYEDLLALLQGDEDGGWSAAVDIAAAYLPNQQVGRYTSGGRVTVVPTSRRPLLGPPRIDPADLLAPGRSPYFLTEAVAALAARVGADTVVMDLRAGATELSAPVLLDPRVQRVFVTTLSHQSKEARSHLWVPAALEDFNDQVQARDVVVFLSEAAHLSIPQTTWEDRVLVPGAMRKALLACSTNKIDSIQQENQVVGDLLSQLQQVRQPVTVPFELEEVGVSVQDADFLVNSGVFARGNDGRYWVAEIYRHGLGYGSERRAKVLWRR